MLTLMNRFSKYSIAILGFLAITLSYAQEDRAEDISILDVDANGEVDALTDGLLLLRSMLGLTDDVLTTGVISSDATVSDATAIDSYITSMKDTTYGKLNSSGEAGADGTPAFEYDTPSSKSAELPQYSGAGSDYASILMFTVPSDGLYWVSLYTETWMNNNSTNAVNSLCAIFKNNTRYRQMTSNVHQHNIGIDLNLLGGDLVELRCASNTGGGFGMNSHGYLQKIQ